MRPRASGLSCCRKARAANSALSRLTVSALVVRNVAICVRYSFDALVGPTR